MINYVVKSFIYKLFESMNEIIYKINDNKGKNPLVVLSSLIASKLHSFHAI